MDSIWTEYSGRRYHVLGIELSDPDLISRTRRVVQICLGLLAVLLIRAVLLLIIGEPAGPTLLSLLFNISIPAFGYLGARDGSTLLMCMFVALMALNAANAIAVLAIITHAAITTPIQKTPNGELQVFKMTTSLWVQSFLIALWAIMAVIGAYHANKLFNHLSKGDFAKRTEDPETGLPQIDTRNDDDNDINTFGLPSNDTLRERNVNDEFDSPVRRKDIELANVGQSLRE